MSLTGIPWRLIGLIVGAAAIVGIVLWVGNRIRVSYEAEARAEQLETELTTEREQNAANIGKIAQDIGDNEKERGALADKLEDIDNRFDNLKINMPAPKSLVQSTEIKDEPCPRVGLSPVFVGVYDATATEAGSAKAKAD